MTFGQVQGHVALQSQTSRTGHWLAMPSILVIARVTYNALLAIVNAHALPLSHTHAMAAEFLLLLAGAGYVILNTDSIESPISHYIFLIVMTALWTWVTLFNQEIYVDFLHDVVLIVLFVLLGSLCSERDILKTFMIITALVIAVMVLEITSIDLYVSIFAPAAYYENTRGITQFLSSGLYRGSLYTNDHFSVGFLDDRRLSSLFLEQVSLANFSSVLCIFMLTFWDRLKRIERTFYLATIILILLGNHSRTGVIVGGILLAGRWLFPVMPRRGQVIIMPAVLLVAAMLFYDPAINAQHWADDLAGRLGLTVSLLADLDVSVYLSGALGKFVDFTQDSGYVYVICTSTIFGLLAFWLYSALLVRPVDRRSNYFAYGLSLYIAANLLIGEAIFTIKVAAPLWMMAGFLYKTSCLKRKEASRCVANRK